MGEVDDGLGVQETTATEGGREIRYLLCRDEERAREDRQVREEIVSRLEEHLEGHGPPKSTPARPAT